MARYEVTPGGEVIEPNRTATLSGPQRTETPAPRRWEVTPSGDVIPIMPPPPVSQDVLQSTTAGIREGAAIPGHLIDMLAVPYARGVLGMTGLDEQFPEPEPVVGPTIEGLLDPVLPAYSPQTDLGRVSQSAARGATAAAVMAPQAATAPLRMATAMSSGSLGDVAGTETQEAIGEGPLGTAGGFAAGVAASTIPGGIGMATRRRAAMQGAREVVAGAPAALGGASPRAVVAAARKLKAMTPGATESRKALELARAKGDLGEVRRIEAAQKGYQQALAALDEAIDNFPEGQRPLLTQVLESEGLLSRNAIDFERVLGQTDVGYDTRANTVRRSAREYATREAREARPAGDPTRIAEDFVHAHEDALLEARAYYRLLPDDVREIGVDLAPIQRRVQEAAATLPVAYEKHMPREAFAVIQRLADEWEYPPIEELDGLASMLKAELRDTQGPARVPLAKILDAVEEGIEEAIGPDHPLYAAHAAWREMKRTYEPGTPRKALAKRDLDLAAQANAAVSLTARGRSIVRSMLNPTGSRPIDVARKARAALRDDPDAMRNLHRAFWDELFGDTLEGETMKGVTPAWERMRTDDALRGAYIELFGKSDWNRNKRLLKMIRQSRYGTAGTAGEARSTGSAQSQIISILSGDVTKREAARGMMRNGVEWAIQTLSPSETNALLREAFLDPEIARALYRVPTGKDLAVWEERMRTYAARALARELGTGG